MSTDVVLDSVRQGIALLSQEYGRKSVPGWLLLFAAIIYVVSAIAKRRSGRARLQAFSELDRRLRIRPATASVHYENAGIRLRQEAWLGLRGDRYELTIDEIADDARRTVASAEFPSLEELAAYLAKQTMFVISDF